MKRRIGIFVTILLFINLILGACSSSDHPKHIEKNTYNINYEHPEKYLISGHQSTLGEQEFAQIEQDLQITAFDLSAMEKIYHWKNTQFKHINGGGKYHLTINDILTQHLLTGCHDHGLVLVSVARKYGVPAIFVDTAGIEWALQYPEQISSFRGHVFVELFLNKQWMLFDSTSGAYVSNYDPLNPIIPITYSVEPKGFYVLYKGIESVDGETLNTYLRRYARMIKAEIQSFQYPNYTIEQL